MFKHRVRVVLIFILGGFVMVSSRLVYLQVVRGRYYRDYARHVHLETLATEASRGRILASDGEILALDRPAFNVAMVASELPCWREVCRPVLRLFRLRRRERVLSMRDVTVLVKARGPCRYAVSFGMAATFLRRKGTELVRSEEEGSKTVDVPRELAEVVEKVAALTNTPADEMLGAFFRGLALVGRGWRRLREPCVVARDVGFLAASEVESNGDRFVGFRVVVGSRRAYPYDELACHVLGYMQPVTAAEYERWREGFAGSRAKRFLPEDWTGRLGVERAAERELRPARGTRTVEVDAARHAQKIIREVAPEPGADVYLTIDPQVQAAAEAALSGLVGSIVVLEAETGRVLAMASSPGFNPNDMPRHGPRPDDPLAPLLNRAVRGQYPLGSAFKLAVAFAALQEDCVPDLIRCEGRYYGYECHNHYLPLDLDLLEAVQRSCNVFFYKLAYERLGIKRLAKWGALLGFGQPTGVALPGEKAGLLPTPAWKRRRFNEHWYRGDTLNLAIGQGYLLVTPLQVARMVAAIANGGRLVHPRLVDKTVEADGRVRIPGEGRPVPSLALPREKLALLHAGMRAVCHEMGGTAHRAWSGWREEQGYEVCGKTGTADAWIRGKRSNVGWFVGFAPSREPRVAFAVAIEHEGERTHGGEVAAPRARRVLERLPERYLRGVPGEPLRRRARRELAQRGMGQ